MEVNRNSFQNRKLLGQTLMIYFAKMFLWYKFEIAAVWTNARVILSAIIISNNVAHSILIWESDGSFKQVYLWYGTVLHSYAQSPTTKDFDDKKADYISPHKTIMRVVYGK